MPKEFIAPHARPVAIVHPDDAHLDEPRRIEVQLAVQVGWNKDGAIQLGVIGWPHNPPAGMITGDFELPGYFTDLDWRACNDLMRVLRRARNAAYGPPE